MKLNSTDGSCHQILRAMFDAIYAINEVKPGDYSTQKKQMLNQIYMDFSNAPQDDDKKLYLALFVQIAGAHRKKFPNLFQLGQTNSLSTFISSLGPLYKGDMKQFIDAKGMKSPTSSKETKNKPKI